MTMDTHTVDCPK